RDGMKNIDGLDPKDAMNIGESIPLLCRCVLRRLIRPSLRFCLTLRFIGRFGQLTVYIWSTVRMRPKFGQTSRTISGSRMLGSDISKIYLRAGFAGPTATFIDGSDHSSKNCLITLGIPFGSDSRLLPALESATFIGLGNWALSALPQK